MVKDYSGNVKNTDINQTFQMKNIIDFDADRDG